MSKNRFCCGIHLGDGFFMGAIQIVCPFAHAELLESKMRLGWRIFRSEQSFELEYKDIVKLEKRGFLFTTYRILHNNKSCPKYLVVSTFNSKFWRALREKLNAICKS